MTEQYFREANLDDANELVSLMVELGYKTSRNDILERIKSIKSRNDKLIVAVEGEVVVGVIHALIDMRLAEGEAGEIVSLIVKHDFRGKGIGRKLVNKAIESLKIAECKTIRVRANTIRKEAHGFYKTLGFVEKKTQKVFEYINV